MTLIQRFRPRHSTPSRLRRAGGLTLVEMLVVVAVIALLIALSLPVLRGASAAARRTVCLGNLRSMGQALQSYASSHNDMLPFATRPADMSAGYLEPVASIASQLDVPVPTISSSGTQVSEVFVCPEGRDVAQRRGWSYYYTPVDLMAGWIDGPPQKAVSSYLRRDPTVVIMTDLDPVHPSDGSDAPLAGRNVLTIGGSAEHGGSRHSVSPR